MLCLNASVVLSVELKRNLAFQVDPSVSFDQVGGLNHYIKALKEMVFLPLVYPELFERFHLSPPRGVLFYGPPGNLSGHADRHAATWAALASLPVSSFCQYPV